MKKILCFGLIFLVMQAAFNPAHSQDIYQNNQQEISYQTFYDELSPYGQWIDYPQYGYVWSPDVDNGFKPYATNGHWVYSDMGWTWVSDYEWGWAAFHYGRWFYDEQYGWLWVPGTEWAPAWVSWRTSDDYYGWAPLLPNISISLSIGSYNPPYNFWCFVPHQYICDPYVNRYYINERRNVTIINHTTVINNVYSSNSYGNRYNNGRTVYACGPNSVEVARFTHNEIRPVMIRDNNRPGNARISNNQLSLYRPNVNANSRGGNNFQQRSAPARAQSFRNPGRTIENNSNNNNILRQNESAPRERLNNDRTDNGFGRRAESFSAPANNGNRSPFLNRQVQSANNQAAPTPMNNRRDFFNNNRNSQPDRRETQPENRPVFNRDRQVAPSPSPVFRNNQTADLNQRRFQQERAPLERVTNRPAQNYNRSTPQPAPERSFRSGRDFGRRER